MATTISTQDIIDAKRDIDDIGKAVNEKVIVSPRYGEDFKSLPMIAAEAQGTINEWQDAINTITVNDGVPALAVLDASGVTQQGINNSLIRTYNSISDLLTIQNPKQGQVAFVRHYDLDDGILDGGGTFVYDPARVAVNDGGVIINGWVRQHIETITPFMFGAKGDNNTDDYQAFFKMLNCLPARASLNIYIPASVYKISKTLFITRPHTIRGVGGIEGFSSALNFSGATLGGLVDVTGAVWIYHRSTASAIPLPAGTVGNYGAGAVLDSICVQSSPANGIVINAPATVNDSIVSGNTENGLVITGGKSFGNANHSIVKHTKCASNGKSGILLAGSDANTFTIIACEVSHNSHYGINDCSLLGGVIMGCEADSNGLAAYNQLGGAADNSGQPASPTRTLWISNYSEGNQPYHYSLNSRSTVIGATGVRPETGVNYLAGSISGLYSSRALALADTEQIAYDESGAFAKLSAGLLKLGWNNVSQKLLIRYNGLGYVHLGTNAAAGDQISFRVGSNFNNAITTYRPYFPNGFALAPNHAQTAANSAPTTGSYERGHVVWNTSPAAGGFAGWICVAGGTPGTWKTFGVIST